MIIDNQDTEEVAEITRMILEAEESGTNTIEFYKSIILKLKGNGNNDK